MLVLLVPDVWVETYLLDAAAVKLLIAVTTSLVWIATTYLTKPESMETLIRFYEQVQPGTGLEKSDRCGGKTRHSIF